MTSQPLDNRNDLFLDYSKISYEDTLSQISSILNLQSPQVMDFFTTSTGRMLMELFAAYNELLYRGIETGLLEGFSATATKLSSAVTNASSMGYSIRRPTPAASSFYVALTGTAGAYAGAFTIPKFTSFSVNGNAFLAIDDYTFKWDSTGKVVAPSAGTTIVQGYLKTVNFVANEGQLFQKIQIADSSFSDYFGDADPLNDLPAASRITTVTVNGVAWDIDRRSLYNPDKKTAPYSKGGTLYKSTNYKCVISTNSEGNVEILFGDGIVAAIPTGTISITYLSTAGAAGAMFNSKDLKITVSAGEISYTPNNSLVDSNLAFYLNESAIGGADLESVQSINHNAPKIYSALDRAITVDDYKAILLTMPNVAHALAYGEDQLGAGDYRYFNVVLFTVIDALYNGTYGALKPALPSEYIISGYNTLGVAQAIQDSGTITANIKETFDHKFDLSSQTNDISTQDKYVQYVNSLGSFFRLSTQNIDASSELGYIMRTLKSKAQATVKHIYFPSKVHKYSMKADIFVTPISSKNTIANDVQQKAFAYLKDNTFFNFPIYSSKIVKIIESLQSIVGCHVSFVPYAGIPTDSSYIDMLLTQSIDIANNLIDTMLQLQNQNPDVVLFPEFTVDGVVTIAPLKDKILETFAYSGDSGLIDYSKLNERNVSNFINYLWENSLGRMILNPYVVSGKIASISDFSNSTYNKPISAGGLLNTNINEMVFDTFIRWAVQFRNDTDYYTAKYVIDSNGDISNFTLPNEIAQIEIDPISDIELQTKTY